MRQVQIGGYKVSGLCLGGNPFSGFSHQSPGRDRQMRDYFTPGVIWETLAMAEEAGINTLFARVDDHIQATLAGYWKGGGSIQWFAQVSPEPGVRNVDHADWRNLMDLAINEGARGIYIHGGIADYWYANGLLDNFYTANECMRGFAVASGFAGHQPAVHAWIRDHLNVDFQMCSHYNPTDRSHSAGHSNQNEKWELADRETMMDVVKTLICPVVHYKIFAGGNRLIKEAFIHLGEVAKMNHVACIGVFPPDDPDMISKNIRLWEQYVEQREKGRKDG